MVLLPLCNSGSASSKSRTFRALRNETYSSLKWEGWESEQSRNTKETFPDNKLTVFSFGFLFVFCFLLVKCASEYMDILVIFSF